LPDATILVLTHVPDRACAETLAKSLLEARLAACVNIGAPVESMYHWRGRIETGNEIPVAIKSRPALYADVEAAIRQAHPYELPEIIAVPIVDGHRPYLDWIVAETSLA
jgi:periplasmic divalent cation tolerance protein